MLLVGAPPAWANFPPVEVANYLGPTGQLEHPGVVPTTFDVDLLAFVTDKDGDPLTVESAALIGSGTSHGLTANGDGTYRFAASSSSFVGTVVIEFTVRELRPVAGGGLPPAQKFELTLFVGGAAPPPPDPPPAAPTNLLATLADPGPAVQLTWRDNAGDEDGYRVWRAVGSGSFIELASLSPNAQSYLDSTVGLGLSYSYFVEAFNTNGSAVSETASITVINVTQGPFRGERYLVGPFSTLIQAEDYDVGGNGISYLDTTPGNLFAEYRNDDVDIRHVYQSAMPALPSNVVVDNLDRGEWLEYSINVLEILPFRMMMRARSGFGTTFHVEVDGQDVAPASVLSSSSSNYKYSSYHLNVSGVGTGDKVLRLAFDGGASEHAVDWIRFDQFPYMMDNFSVSSVRPKGPLTGTSPEERLNSDLKWAGSSRLIRKTSSANPEGFVGIEDGSTASAVGTVPIEFSETMDLNMRAWTLDADVKPGGDGNRIIVGFTASPSGAFSVTPSVENPSGHGQLYLELSSNGDYKVFARGDSQILVSGNRPLETDGPTSVRMELTGMVSRSEPMHPKVWIDHFQVCCNDFVDLKTLVEGWDPMPGHAGFQVKQVTGEAQVDGFMLSASYNGSVEPPGPIAVDDDRLSVGINEDGGPVVLEGILDNDVPPLLVELMSAHVIPQPTSSTVSIGQDGRSLVYTPGPDFSGYEGIIYRIVDDQGKQDSAGVEVFVTPVNDPPTAGISLSCSGSECNYDSAPSSDIDNSPAELAFAWSFGDGKTSNLALGSHRYEEEGVFPVTLTATDPGPASDTATTSTIIDPPPTAVLRVDCFDLVCIFDGTGSTRDGVHPDGLSFDWSFGDGASPTVQGPVVVHEYAAQGIYNVALTTTDSGPRGGQTAQTSQSLDLDFPPVPVFTFTCLDLTCSFDAGGSSGDSVGFSWNFGDGSATGSGAVIEHTFPTDGTFNVTLTVTDPGGQTGAVSQSAEVFDELLFLLLQRLGED